MEKLGGHVTRSRRIGHRQPVRYGNNKRSIVGVPVLSIRDVLMVDSLDEVMTLLVEL